MKATRRIAILVLLLTVALPCWAAKKYIEIDTSECQPQTPTESQTFTSEKFIDTVHGIQAYGQVSIQRTTQTSEETHCHVILQLFVAGKDKIFSKVNEVEWDTTAGQIAAIELIGLSKDGSKFAADYLLAEGDGQSHQPVIYDFPKKKVATAPLEGKIQHNLHCYRVEDFIGVTNTGEAIFSVPPSTYVDTPECGDGGVWYFNLQTGKVIRVKMLSGDRWE